MFESLTDKLELTFKKLSAVKERLPRKILTMPSGRFASPSLRLMFTSRSSKSFLETVKAKSLGQEVLQSLTPEQQFLKIVRDELVNLLGGEHRELDLKDRSAGSDHARRLTGLR